jgi:hypothetical protein
MPAFQGASDERFTGDYSTEASALGFSVRGPMASKYLSGTYTSRYTLTGALPGSRSAPPARLAAPASFGGTDASYAIVDLSQFAASTMGASGIR